MAARDLGTLALGGKDVTDNNIHGFSVDEQGNALFTIPTQFRAYALSPDGHLRAFGRKGSRPGMFNIAGPIAADEEGYVYVADTLRAVVMIFSPALEFLVEFGGSGDGPGDLASPTDLAIGHGKVFVSQGRERGVSVFLVRRE